MNNIKNDKNQMQLDIEETQKDTGDDKCRYINQTLAVNELISTLRNTKVTARDLDVFSNLMVGREFYYSSININLFSIDQKKLAKKMLMSASNLSRSIKNLISADLLEKTADKKYRIKLIDKFTYEESIFD